MDGRCGCLRDQQQPWADCSRVGSRLAVGSPAQACGASSVPGRALRELGRPPDSGLVWRSWGVSRAAASAAQLRWVRMANVPCGFESFCGADVPTTPRALPEGPLRTCAVPCVAGRVSIQWCPRFVRACKMCCGVSQLHRLTAAISWMSRCGRQESAQDTCIGPTTSSRMVQPAKARMHMYGA